MSTVEQLTKERDEARAALVQERVGNCFDGSRFVRERMTLPADIVRAAFAKQFAVQEGRVVGRDDAGNMILSRERLGEPADFDEALEVIVRSSEHAPRIMRQSGSGGGGGAGAGKTMSRRAFEGMPPDARMGWIKGGGRIVD